MAGHREADGSVVDTDAVPDLAAEKLIYGLSGHLPGDVPQGYFDCAYSRAPGLKGAHAADLQHHARDVCRVFADQVVLIKEDHRLEVGLVGLGLTITGDALIGDDANRRIAPDDGAAEISDLDRCLPRAFFGCRQILLSTKRLYGRCRRERCDESSARPIFH